MKKGELIVEAQWRFPSDGLAIPDVDTVVSSLRKSLLEVGLKPHSVSGYAVTEGQPERSTGYQFVIGPTEE